MGFKKYSCITLWIKNIKKFILINITIIKYIKYKKYILINKFK